MPVSDEGASIDRTAVDKALDLLFAFGERGHTNLGVSELARRASLSKSTAFRLLALLERRGVVERAGTSYRLGARLHDLGTQVYAPGHDQLRELLTPLLAELFVLTQSTVHLAVLHGTEVLYLNKLSGPRTVSSPSRIGGRAPARCTALGKAMLAFDAAATDQAMHDTRTARTPTSLVTEEALSRALADVRRRGIAVDDEESRLGLRCVAVPIFDARGRAVAAMSVTGAPGQVVTTDHGAALRRISHAASTVLSRHAVPRPPHGRTTLTAVGA